MSHHLVYAQYTWTFILFFKFDIFEIFEKTVNMFVFLNFYTLLLQIKTRVESQVELSAVETVQYAVERYWKFSGHTSTACHFSSHNGPNIVSSHNKKQRRQIKTLFSFQFSQLRGRFESCTERVRNHLSRAIHRWPQVLLPKHDPLHFFSFFDIWFWTFPKMLN